MEGTKFELTQRELAILRAVAAGRGEILASCEPDLAVDGGWCDHAAVHHLVWYGLIRAVHVVEVGRLTKATLTAQGRQALTAGVVSPAHYDIPAA